MYCTLFNVRLTYFSYILAPLLAIFSYFLFIIMIDHYYSIKQINQCWVFHLKSEIKINPIEVAFYVRTLKAERAAIFQTLFASY